MSQNVGSIVYTVEADTSNLVNSSTASDRALDNLQRSFDKTDRAAKKTEQSTEKAAKGIGSVGDSAGSAGKSVGGLTAKLTPLASAIAGVITVQTLAAWGKIAEQFTLLRSRINRLSPDLQAASQNYQQLLNIASSTGQSMPQTVKLWEALTSSLKSLGATNDQVLQLTSTLQKIGKIGGSSADETANALRQLGQSLAGGALRAEEYNSIVEQTPELIRQLAAAADMSMGDFRQAMLDGKVSAEMLFDLLQKRTVDVDNEFRKLPRSASDAGNAVSVAFGAALAKIDEALGASTKLARALDELAFGVAKAAGNATAMDNLNAKFRDLEDLQRELARQNDSWLPNKRQIADLEKRIRSTKDEIAQMQAAMAPTKTISTPKEAATTTDDGQKVIQSLAEQNQQLRAQGIERAKIIALQKLGAAATQKEKDAAVALAIENYNLQESERARQKSEQERIAAASKAQSQAAQERRKEETERQQQIENERKGIEQNQKVFASLGQQLAEVGKTAREVAQDQAQLSLNQYATPEQVEQVRALAAALYDANQAQTNNQLLGQMDPIAAEQQNFETQLESLRKLNEAKLLEDQRYLELKSQAEQQHDEQMKQLEEERFRRQSRGNELLMASLDQLQAAGASATVGLITGASNGEQAMQALAGAILNEVVGSFWQMGIAQVKAWVMGQAAQAAAGAAYAASVAGQVTTNTALAAQAAFASTAAIPIVGPALAPAAAATAASSAAALGQPALAASALAGARQYGGPVRAGGLYRINENGAPEVYQAANGRQYMLPNTRGEVISNRDATGQAKEAVKVEVHLHQDPARAGQVQQQQGPDGSVMVSAWVANLMGDGEVEQALRSKYALEPVGR